MGSIKRSLVVQTRMECLSYRLKMYNRQPCVTDDSYQLSHEHLRQLECAGHFRSSTEVPSFKFVSGKQQLADGEQDCFDSGADLGFRVRTDDISSVFTASVLDCTLNPSIASESSLGTAVIENGKRPSIHFCDEMANKRARQEDQEAKLEHSDGNSFVSIPPEGKHPEEAEWRNQTAIVDTNVKGFEAGGEVHHQITRSDPPEDVFFQFSDHFHWRHVPIGPDHQADLPNFTSPDSNSSSINLMMSYASHDEASDKWLGTIVSPMPDPDSIAAEARICHPKIVCDCADEGSIKCVWKHVTEAREKLIKELGEEEFIQLGFSHMGETVSQRWTEEEENLFYDVVQSNPESAGRNFWVMLRKPFPSSSFKELVSYYFNVFILRKRAHQNRFDRSNVDSDDDEWRESGDMDFPDEGEEEVKSVLGSLPVENDDSHPVGTDEEEDYRALQTLDGNSAHSTSDYEHNDGNGDSNP
ncbi:uncharacterized protein LOC110019569 isoform X2 [Phalaenopsis equestris]|uniref:uncharacterized protein LOC110019569 isoform X2 n=1 Tax=Phalaenopsis equestris TaxID=78828 RepID=UPI0009E3702E|nr:uncharacterized protein LOC110019569 isoform X2 [Phalaenopsis equestris]